MKIKNKKLIIATVLLAVVLIVSFGFAVTYSDWLVYIEKYREIGVHEAYAIITYKMYTNMTILDVRTQETGEFGS